MLDKDLAQLYNNETKVLKQAVLRKFGRCKIDLKICLNCKFKLIHKDLLETGNIVLLIE